MPLEEVQDRLRVSYEALQYEQQHIFLDIALFLNEKEKSYPIYMWDACDFSPNTALEALISLSLVKIEGDKLSMRDQFVGLGREIVRQEGLQYSKCSRYWDPTGQSLGELKSNYVSKSKITALLLTNTLYFRGNIHTFLCEEFILTD